MPPGIVNFHERTDDQRAGLSEGQRADGNQMRDHSPSAPQNKMIDESKEELEPTNALYDAIHDVIFKQFPELSAFETIGCLEAIKAEMLDKLPKR
jgi:hypothetical protein